MILQEELQKLGLSEKAAKTYLAALEVGSSPVQTIAQKANLSRTTVYPQIEELIKLGLMTTVERGKKTFYNAEAPRQLDLLLKKQEDEITSKREELIKKIPELEALIGTIKNKPIVKFYEGRDGVIALREDLMQDSRHKRFLSFTAIDDFLVGLPSYEQDQADRRAEKQLPIKIIYTKKSGKHNWEPGKLREIRYIPYDKFPFSSSISISPGVGIQINKHAGGYIGVVIDSPEIAKTLESVFKLCWKAAEEYN